MFSISLLAQTSLGIGIILEPLRERHKGLDAYSSNDGLHSKEKETTHTLESLMQNWKRYKPMIHQIDNMRIRYVANCSS